jgi:hypothetical protein
MNHWSWVKFCIQIYHKYAYKFYMKHFYNLTITNMGMVHNAEVMSDKLNVVRICT